MYVVSDVSYILTRVVQLALSNAIGDLKHTIKEKTSGNELFNKSLFTKRVLNRHNSKTTIEKLQPKNTLAYTIFKSSST